MQIIRCRQKKYRAGLRGSDESSDPDTAGMADDGPQRYQQLSLFLAALPAGPMELGLLASTPSSTPDLYNS